MLRKGYRKKPNYIWCLGIAYFILPIITLYHAYLNIDRSFTLLREIAFSRFFLSELFFCFTAGMAILSVSRAGFLYFIAISACSLGVKIGNLWAYSIFESPLDFVGIFFWFITTLLFLLTALRRPYLNPKTRWWKQPPRYSHEMAGVLTVKNMQFPVSTLNFSLNGVFLKLDDAKISQDIRRKESFCQLLYQRGQTVALEMDIIPEAKDIFPQQKLFTRAKVVWYTKKETVYLYGLGLEFINPGRLERKQLKRYVRRLKSCCRLQR